MGRRQAGAGGNREISRLAAVPAGMFRVKGFWFVVFGFELGRWSIAERRVQAGLVGDGFDEALWPWRWRARIGFTQASSTHGRGRRDIFFRALREMAA